MKNKEKPEYIYIVYFYNNKTDQPLLRECDSLMAATKLKSELEEKGYHDITIERIPSNSWFTEDDNTDWTI